MSRDSRDDFTGLEFDKLERTIYYGAKKVCLESSGLRWRLMSLVASSPGYQIDRVEAEKKIWEGEERDTSAFYHLMGELNKLFAEADIPFQLEGLLKKKNKFGLKRVN
jgi:hypothetical protein